MDNNLTVQYISFDNHKMPEFIEVRGKDYVLYGKDNLYPNYLLELKSRCSKHNAIINSKSRFVSGGGLDTENEQAKIFLANKINSDDANEVFEKISLDFEVFGGYALGVTWSASKKIASFQHLDFGKYRESKDGKTVIYCEDWSDARIVRDATKVTAFQKFDVKNPVGFQVIYFKAYSPYYKKLAYPFPSYLGAIPSIETDVEISNFHLNNIKNGFSGSTMVILKNGEPTPEKKREIEKQFKAKHTGTDKAGGVLIIYANRNEDAAEVKNLSASDLDKQFAQLREGATQEIFVGHEITSPILFGIKEAGQLGGRNELIEAFELFNNSYVAYRQRLFEKQFNELAVLAGVSSPAITVVKIKPLNIDITVSAVSAVMTPDEIREVVGLKPIDKSQNIGAENTVKSINSLSPLVANKVLNNLTTNELRSLVGLAPIAGGENVPTATPSAMSEQKKQDEEMVIALLSAVGESSQSFEEVKEDFADALTADEKKSLGVLKSNPLATAIDISTAVKITPEQAQKAIESLTKKGLITVDEKGATITDKGATSIDENNIRTIEIRYKYEAKTGPDKLPNGRTRAFCTFIVDEKKLYTREEIDSISAKVGFSVWAYRGGWYHNPSTDENQPFCRHIWKQVSVVRKK